MTLIDQALALAQEGLYVFPVNADKTPACKNGHRDATIKPYKIEELFGVAPNATHIGVWLKKSGLCAFDVDTMTPGSPKWNAKLKAGATVEELTEVNRKLGNWMRINADELNRTRIHTTQNGGWHYIFKHTSNSSRGGKKLPMVIMGEILSLKWDGYIVWSGPGYTVKKDTEPKKLPKSLVKVIEKAKAAGGDGYTTEQAEAVMDSDGKSGERHLALNRLAIDFVNANPDLTGEALADEFMYMIRQEWPTVGNDRPSRFEWRWDEREKKLEGELGRSLQGALRFRAVDVGFADDIMAKAGARMKERGIPVRPAQAPTVEEKKEKKRKSKVAKLGAEFETLDLDEVISTEIADIDWILNDVIPRGNVVSITGPSGAGKTRFNTLLMAALSSGRTDIMGLPKCKPARAMYIANEERTEDIKRRLKAAAVLNGISGGEPITVRGLEKGRFKLMADGEVLEDVIDKLVEEIKERGIDVVMIDPVVTIGIAEENAAGEVDVAMDAMRRIASRSGAAVIFVHHSPKRDRTAPEDALRGDAGAWRGSSVFHSSIDLGMTLMPWLPDECHDKQAGAANRRTWRKMIREHEAPNYVVLDSAKERENVGFGSVLYKIVGQEVRVGGLLIGAMQCVPETEARAVAAQLLCQADLPQIDMAEVTAVCDAVLSHPKWGKDGNKMVSLNHIVTWLDMQKPAGWNAEHKVENSYRTDRGAGRAVVNALTKSAHVGRGHLSVEVQKRGVLVSVSRSVIDTLHKDTQQ